MLCEAMALLRRPRGIGGMVGHRGIGGMVGHRGIGGIGA